MAFSKIAAENLGGSTLPALAGGSLTGISAGKIGQVVTANVGNSDITSTSATYADLVTLNITPSATSSTILIYVLANYNLFGNNTTAEPEGYLALRDSSNNELTRGFTYDSFTNSSKQHDSGLNIHYLFSPNSTSQQTYKLSFKALSGGRFRIHYRPTRITAMEVLA